MMKVRQHLWFRHDMEAAIEFYMTLIPGSTAGWVSNILTDDRNGPAGSVKFAGFTIGDQSYMGFEAGPFDRSDHQSCITFECSTQDEANRLRDALGQYSCADRRRVRDAWGIYWHFVVKSQGNEAEDAGEIAFAKAKRAVA